MRRAPRRTSGPARKHTDRQGFRAPSVGSLLSALACILVLAPVAVMAYVFLVPDRVSSADELLHTHAPTGNPRALSGEIDWGDGYRNPPARPGQQDGSRPRLLTAPSQIRVSEVVGVQLLAAPASGTPMVTVTTSNDNVSLSDGCSGNKPNSVIRENHAVIFLVGCNEGQTTLTLSQSGASDQSYSINVVARPAPDDTATPVPTVVGYPLNLAASPHSSLAQVSLTWTSPAADTCECLVPTSWKLEYESAGTVRSDYQLPANMTSVSVTDLLPGTTYTFHLRGINGPRFSEWTSITATTPGDPPDPETGGGIPGAVGLPVSLVASTTDTTLSLSWSAPAEETCDCLVPDGWHVEFEGPGGQRRNAGTVAAGTTSMMLNNLTPGSVHTVYVRGVHRSVRVSPWVSITRSTTGDAPDETGPDTAAQLPVGRPAGLTAAPTSGSDTSIDVSWTAPSDAATCACVIPTEWQVEYEDREGHRRAWGVVSGTSATITGLDPGSSYTVFVRGLAGARVGAWFSNSTTTTGLPPHLVNATNSQLDPLRPVTLGDARLLTVPSQLRVGEVQGVQPVGAYAEGDPPPNITLTVSDASILSLGDGCSSPQQAATVVSGAVVYLIGCSPGITNLSLNQDVGSATTYQIRVVPRPEYPTPEPTVVGYAQGFTVSPQPVASGTSAAAVTLSWRIPTCGDGECWKPDLWKVEYESANTVRSDFNLPRNTTSVNINNLLPGTVYTFYIRGIYEPRSLFGEWISRTAMTRGDPPEDDDDDTVVVDDGLPVGLAGNPSLTTAAAASTTALVFSWDNPDADSCECRVPDRWQIEYEDDDGFRKAHDVVDAATTTTTVAGLDPGTDYTVHIRGLAGARAGAWLSASSRTSGERESDDGTTLLTTTDVVGFPENFGVTSLNVASAAVAAGVTLNWDPPDPDTCDCRPPDRWDIQYESEGVFRGNHELPAATTDLTIRTLLPGTVYTFHIRGVSGARVSAWISRTAATGGDPPEDEDTVVLDDGRPVGLARNLSVTRDSAASTTALVFSWENPDADSCECRVPDRWQIEYEDDDGFRQGHDVVASGSNRVTLTGLSPGTAYTVYIRGLTGSRLGGWLSSSSSTSGEAVRDGPLDPNRPITIGDAQLLSVPSHIRVGEVRGLQVVADHEEGEELPRVTVSVTDNGVLSLGDSCLSPQYSVNLFSGAVFFVAGCVEGVVTMALDQEGGETTTYQIRVVGRTPFPTMEPEDVGYAMNFTVTSQAVASGAVTAGVTLSWAKPDPATCECRVPDKWKLEYESADTVRSDHDFPVNITSVNIGNLRPGTVYTFYIRGIAGSRFGEWISITTATGGDPPAGDTLVVDDGRPVGLARNLSLARDSAASTTALVFSWDNPDADSCECRVPDRWQIEYEDDDGFRQGHDVVASGSNRVTLTGLSPGTAYTVYIRGLTGSRLGGWLSISSSTSGEAVRDGPLDPNRPITIGDAQLLNVPSHIRVGEVRGLQVVADHEEGEPLPRVTVSVTDNGALSLGDSCLSPQYSVNLFSGAVFFVAGCVEGVVTMALDQEGGETTTYRIRVVGRTPFPTPEPDIVGFPSSLQLRPAENVPAGASTTMMTVTWAAPDAATCECRVPTMWKLEYESARDVRQDYAYLLAGTTTSVTVTGLSLGTRYTFHIRGIDGARVSVWVSLSATTGGDPPDDEVASLRSLPVGLPQNLTAAAVAAVPDGLRITWDKPADTGDDDCECIVPVVWQLEYEITGTNGRYAHGPVTSTSVDLGGLLSGTNYNIYVRGLSSSGAAGAWVGIRMQTGGEAPADHAVPSIPVGTALNLLVEPSASGGKQVLDVGWMRPADARVAGSMLPDCNCVVPDSWQVEYEVDGARYAYAGLIPAPDADGLVMLQLGTTAELLPNRQYTVWVRGLAGARAGAWTGASVWTTSGQVARGDVPVGAPSNISALASETSAVIRWGLPADDCNCIVPDRWQVEYEAGDSGRFAVGLVDASAGTASTTIGDLTPGTLYSVFIRGVRHSKVGNWFGGFFRTEGNPPPSAGTVSVRPVGLPAMLTATASMRSLVISWSDPADDCECDVPDYYQLEFEAEDGARYAYHDGPVRSKDDGTVQLTVDALLLHGPDADEPLLFRAGVVYTVHVRGISGERAGQWVSATTRTAGVPSAGLPVGMAQDFVVSSTTEQGVLLLNWKNPKDDGNDPCDCVRPLQWQVEYQSAAQGRHAYVGGLLEASAEIDQMLRLDDLRPGTDHTVYLRGLARSRAGEWVSRQHTSGGDPPDGDGDGTGGGFSGAGGPPVCLPERLDAAVNAAGLMTLTWEPPAEDATCVVPDSWQVEYEDHTGRRFAVSTLASDTQQQRRDGLGPRVIISGLDPVNVEGSYSVPVPNLRSGVEYTFYVRGVNDGRVSEWDAVSQVAGLFSNNIPPPVNCQVMTAPDENNPGRSKVVLTWSRPNEEIPMGAVVWRIEQAQTRNAAFSRVIGGIPRILWVNQVNIDDVDTQKDFSHTVGDLNPGERYTWRILTVVDGRASTRVCVLDQETDPLHTPTPLPVGTCFPPQGFSGTANGRQSAKLGWTDPTGAPPNCVVEGYVVGWARGALDRHFLGGPANVVDWQDRSLPATTKELTYFYLHDMRYHVTAVFRIKALYQGGNESRWVYAFLPLPDADGELPPSLLPRNLRAVPQPPGDTVRLGWHFYEPAVSNPYFVVEEWSSTGMRWTPSYHGPLPICDYDDVTPLNTPVPTSTPGSASQTVRGILPPNPVVPPGEVVTPSTFYCLDAIDLLPNVDYQWRVRVYYQQPAIGIGAPQANYGPWANFPVYSYGGGGTEFPPPENVRLSSPTQSGMSLEWDIPDIPVGETLRHFIVELRGIFPEADEVEPWRSPTGSSTVTTMAAACADPDDDVCALALTGLFTETSYEVRVRIVYTGGESRWIVATATTLSPSVLPPVDPYISSPETDSLLLKWTEPAKEASVTDQYWVRVKGFYEEDISDQNFRIVARDLVAGDGSGIDGVCAAGMPGGRACEYRIGDLQSEAVYQVEVRRVVDNLGSRWVRTAGRTLSASVPIPVRPTDTTAPTATPTPTPTPGGVTATPTPTPDAGTPTPTPTRPANFINAPKISTACDANDDYDADAGEIDLEWGHDTTGGGAAANYFEVEYRVVVNHRPGPWIHYETTQSTRSTFRGVVRGEDYAFRVTAVALASADHPELRATSVSCLVTTEDAVLEGTPTATLTPDPFAPFVYPPYFDCDDTDNGAPALTYDDTNMANAIKVVWAHSTMGSPPSTATGTVLLLSEVGAQADYYEVDYRVWANGRPGQWTSLSAVSATMLTYRGVVAGEGYDFRVTAVSRANRNRPELRATSLPCFIMPDGENIPDPTPDAIPTPANFQVVEWESEALTLGWDRPPDLDEENITGYELRYREVQGGTDWLTPRTQAGEVTPVGKVDGLGVRSQSQHNSVLLTWNPFDQAVAGTRYQVRWSTDREFGEDALHSGIDHDGTTETQLRVNDLEYATRYYFQVRVDSSLAESPWSPEGTNPPFADLPPEPASPKVCNDPAGAPTIHHLEDYSQESANSFAITLVEADGQSGLDYDVRHDTDQYLSNPVIVTRDDYSSLLEIVDELAEDTRYYVQVRVRGATADDNGPWSCAAHVHVNPASDPMMQRDEPFARQESEPEHIQRVEGLLPETTYEFQVRAITTWGVEDNWAYTVGTTLAEGEDGTLEPPTPAPTLPGVVQPPPGCSVAMLANGNVRVRVIVAPSIVIPGLASDTVASLPLSSLKRLGQATHYRIEYRPVGAPDWRTLAGLVPASAPYVDQPDDGVVYEYRVFGLVFGSNSFTESYAPSSVCRSNAMPPARIIPTRPVVGDSDLPASVELGWDFPSLSRIAPTPVFIIEEHVPNSGLPDPWLPVHTDDDCSVIDDGDVMPLRIDRDHCTVFGGIQDGVEYRLAVKAIYFDRILGTYVETPRAYFRPFSYRSRPSGDLTAPLGFAGRDISRNLDDPEPEDIWVLLNWEGSEGADAYQVERLEIYEEAEVVDWVGSTEYRVHTHGEDATFDRRQGWDGLHEPPRLSNQADLICESIYVPDVGDAIWPWEDDPDGNYPRANTPGGGESRNFYDAIQPESTTYKKHANRRPLFVNTDPDLLNRNRSVNYDVEYGAPVGDRLRTFDYDGHQTYFAITEVRAVRGDDEAKPPIDDLPFHVHPHTGQIRVRSFASVPFGGEPPGDDPVVFVVSVRAYDQAGGVDDIDVTIAVSNPSGDKARTDDAWDTPEVVVPTRPVATRTPPDDGDEHILFQSGSTATPTTTPTATPTVTPTLSEELEGVRLVRQCHVAIGNGELDGGTTYSFRVYALDARGNPGPYSETIQVTTQGRPDRTLTSGVPTVEGQVLLSIYPEPQSLVEGAYSYHELTMSDLLDEAVLTTGASGRIFMMALHHSSGEDDCPPGRPIHIPTNGDPNGGGVPPYQYATSIRLVRADHFHELDPEAGIDGVRLCLFAATLRQGDSELQRLSAIVPGSGQLLREYEINILAGDTNPYFDHAPFEDFYLRGQRYPFWIEFTDAAGADWKYSITFANAEPDDDDDTVDAPVRITDYDVRNTPDCDQVDAGLFQDRWPYASGANAHLIYPTREVTSDRDRVDLCLQVEQDWTVDQESMEIWLSGILTLASTPGCTPAEHPKCSGEFTRFAGEMNIIDGLRDRLREAVPKCGDNQDDVLCLRLLVQFFCSGLGMSCDSELFVNFIVILLAVGLASVPLIGSWRTEGQVAVLYAVFAYLLLILVLMLGVLLVDLPEYQAAIPVLIATVGGALVAYGRFRSRT